MPTTGGYSARVRLSLMVEGLRLSLAQVMPGLVILREPCDPIPASDGQIVISVDGNEETMDAFFPHGVGGSELKAIYY